MQSIAPATLYMAALTALRHNPIVRALGERLKAKGKGGKRAVAAAMRKLVRLIYGVLKQGKPFDPNWENRDRAVGRHRVTDWPSPPKQARQ